MIAVLTVAGLMAVVSAGRAVPADAAAAKQSGSPGSQAAPAPAATARSGLLAMVTTVPGVSPRTAAQAGSAAATCVRYATRAGWANNGYFGGDLVTAAAICVAESAGKPGLYVCDNASGDAVGQGIFSPGHPVKCPAGFVSYDRGLWQLNSKNAKEVNGKKVTDTCAFNAVCNAGQAYLFSQRGTDFEPWSSYDQDVYTQFIDPVQTAVTKLTSGTLTSALLGECLAQARSAVNAKVVIANCGSGGTTQQWTVTGGKLRSGSVCAAIGAGTSPGVVLRRCAGSRAQSWASFGRAELRNGADGKCLTKPGSSLAPGTAVDVTKCVNAKDQTWWLP